MSAMQVRVRYIGMAMPLVLQLWMFATPVAYPISVIPAWLRPYYLLNPMAAIIDGYRSVLIVGTAPDLPALGLSVIVTAMVTGLGLTVFKHAARSFADVI